MINEGNIFVFDNNEGVADFAVTEWIEISSQAIAAKGSFTAALSGGKTPVGFYKRLATSKDILSWDRTHIFLADERFVPPSHNESNYGLIKEHLLSHVKIPDDNVHRIQTEEITLEESARRYEEDIRRFLRIEGGSVPQFDLIMLGIGEDGHTASLFPGTGLLRVTERLALPVTVDKVPSHRISFSLPVLTNAKRIVFLVTGANKANVVKEIIEDEECALPAALLLQQSRGVWFVLDESAGSLLSQRHNRM
jgi:6-phosphogluconolactonase